MFVILWKFRPAPGRELEFESMYGPDGAWARFFRRGSGYFGTALLRGDDGTYVTIDKWRDEASYEAFLGANRARHEEIDRAGENLTREEILLGRFSELT